MCFRGIGIVLGLILCHGTASAGLFTLDGIYNPANDDYTHQFVFPLILDNGESAGTTEFKVGVGSNADGETGGDSDLFLYLELPLNLKDMTWGTGTHEDYSGGQIAIDKNTGSEKVAFQWNGESVEVKLGVKDDVGHELKEDGGGAVIGVMTSLDYIMNNFPNTEDQKFWGGKEKKGKKGKDEEDEEDGSASNSPTLRQDSNGNDLYETFDPTLGHWPFHQSWEIQISGEFGEEDLVADLLTDPQFFGADFTVSEPAAKGKRGKEESGPNFFFHASPVKDGEKFDIIPEDQVYEIQDIPTDVPEPASVLLFGLGIVGLVGLARRRRK